MEFKDYYATLGVSRDARRDEIKRAYRKLARKFHPDVSKEPDAEARFKEVNEAYEVLKDTEKRGAYDQLGSGWHTGEDFRPPPDWDQGFEFRGGSGAGDASRFSEFFENLFGQGFARQGARAHGGFDARGQDTHARVLVDLGDAFAGSVRPITLKHTEIGADGRPQVRDRTLKVRIPRGVRAGQQIRLAGQGGAGIGRGGAGDLYLEIAFRPHALYRAEGRDLSLDLPLAPWEAALGATVEVPTPGGQVDLRIPAGTRDGSRLRLQGRGIPGREPGDLYAVVRIALPPADSAAAEAAYRAFAEAVPFDPRSKLAGQAA